MTSAIRRAGADILRLIKQAADPGGEANRDLVYTKAVAGVTQLFAQSSDNTVHQLTPVTPATTVPPQTLVNPKYGGANGTVVLGTNAARAMFIGYAYRAFAAGEVFPTTWRNSLAGNTFTWGEISLGTGALVGNTNPVVTPVAFTDIATPLATAATTFVTNLTIAGGQAITAGAGLWIIFAKASTGSPTLVSCGAVDDVQSGIQGTNTTAGFRPSLNIGVATTFTIDTATLAIKSVTVAPFP